MTRRLACAGVPLLVAHGSGGGHDQGVAFAGPLAQRGIRVIAMSRLGDLRTPMPADASAEAQADAHVCLLDALAIRRAAVMGGSAGAPSALQMALRHPDRVSALILRVPLTYKPPTPPERPRAASPRERARVNAMVDHILPVSGRVAGLRSDTAVGKHLAPSAPETLRVPTLIVSARVDRHGTYASAAYTASRVAGANFIGFDQVAHLGRP